MMLKKCKLHYGTGTKMVITNPTNRPPVDVEVDPELGARFVEMMRAQAADRAAVAKDAAPPAEPAAADYAPRPKRKRTIKRKSNGGNVVVTDQMLEIAIRRRYVEFESVKVIAADLGVKPKTLSARMIRWMNENRPASDAGMEK